MEPESPYSPPANIVSDPTSTELERKKTFWKQAGWVSLSLLVIPPLVGIIGSIIAMTKAFAGMADHGIGDPEKLAAAIGEALIATAAGVFFALPAFVFLIISIIRFRSYRARIRKQPA